MKTENPFRFVIREASFNELLLIHQQIPEFSSKISMRFYEERLKNTLHLALVAELEGKVIGFKVGYQSDNHKTFYSWMGGVIPEFRKSGVASALAKFQENWARDNGFKEIFFKTRNRFPAMISFGLKRDFKITGVIRKESVVDYRIVMMKKL